MPAPPYPMPTSREFQSFIVPCFNAEVAIDLTVARLRHICRKWLLRRLFWRARWTQPIPQPGYQSLVAVRRSLWPRLYFRNRTQVHSEHSGTQQGVRDGEAVAAPIADDLLCRP